MNFFNRLSLRAKVAFIGVVPFLCFLGMSCYEIRDQYLSYKEAELLQSKIDVIKAASNVVNESQKERGKTAGYLGGGVTFKALEAQRAVNDQKIIEFREIIETSSFSQAYKDELYDHLAKYDGIRTTVSKGQAKLGPTLKAYTQIILRFLRINLDVAETTSFSEVSASLRTFKIIEDSKESGGKLRANMTSILAKNKPITAKKFNAIIALNSGVTTNLKSSGLVLDKKSIGYIKSFKNSSAWSEVTGVFKTILNKSSEGGYNKNASEFFQTITQALNILGDLIGHQKASLTAQVKNIQAQSLYSLQKLSVILLSICLLTSGVIYVITNMLSKRVKDIVTRLVSESGAVTNSSVEISSSSNELSIASSQSASSLQETVSSIDEISSMVERNSDTAQKSSSVSEESNKAAGQGKKTIDNMISSIEEIAESNNEISKIVEVISEIGEKTKVINDIVFQTKLLSINASVEAARAGEHGKGFAVVAEEVGNLASVSGEAALDITTLLDSSIANVKDIVEKTKSRVEIGKQTAGQCRSVFDEILSNANQVNELIAAISTASQEQSIGVREVTKAMQQLDQVTHQNSTIASSNSHLANQIKKQAAHLNDITVELRQLVSGTLWASKDDFNEKGGTGQNPSSGQQHLSLVDKKVS